MLLASIASLILILDARLHPHAPYDPRLLREVQSVDMPLLNALLRPADLLTSAAGAVTMWALSLLVFAGLRRWRQAMVLVLIPAAGIGDNLIGLIATAHTRPTLANAQRVADGTDSTSFPSGHVLGAVLLYGFLFVVAGGIPRRAVRLSVRVACVAIIVGSGIARLWYGAHWPSDVLGGYVIGGALLMALLALHAWLGDRNRASVPGEPPAAHQGRARTPSRAGGTSRDICQGQGIGAIIAGLIPEPGFPAELALAHRCEQWPALDHAQEQRQPRAVNARRK